jgi:hypothetical protein
MIVIIMVFYMRILTTGQNRNIFAKASISKYCIRLLIEKSYSPIDCFLSGTGDTKFVYLCHSMSFTSHISPRDDIPPWPIPLGPNLCA